MKVIGGIVGSIVALALIAGSPDALAQKPLRMDLPKAATTIPVAAPRPAPAALSPRAQRRSFTATLPQVDERDRRLIDRTHARQEALSTLGIGLLAEPDPQEASDSATDPADGYPSFKFKKQGHLARDLRRGYRQMGERLAGRVFDEPRGKRIVFDVAGKPGVGVEIPLH